MICNVQGMVVVPTLFFSNDGVSFFATPEESWFVSEILERMVSFDTEAVYSLELFTGDAEKSFALRQIEINMRLDQIEKLGVDNIKNKKMVYAKC